MKNKKFYLILLISILILFTILFFLPKIFSTRVGTNFLLKRIENKIPAQIEIESFNFSWLGPQKITKMTFKDANLDLKVDSIVSNVSLFSFYKSLHTYKKLNFFANTEIKNLDVYFHFPNRPKASIYNVFASIKAGKTKISSIKINGKTKEASKVGNINAEFDFKDNKIYSKITGTTIPTIGVDELLFFNKKKYKNILDQILGPSFDIEINSTLENQKGPINIDFKSTYSKTKLNLFYQKDSITLNENALLTIDLPGINPTFLKNITYIKSEKPITISILKNGFEIPIPFKLENIKLKLATIDLSKQIVSNTGIIKTLTTFAKMPSTDTVLFWFTTLNLNVENKTLFFDRMDFLVNNEIHLCSWGKVDLFDHHLKLNLGLPTDTLESVFNIENLPNDYVIKIPINGTIENPKIDAKSATSKIIALSTLQKAKGFGSIIGGVLTRLKKEEKAPNAKKPFPWEGKILRKSSINEPIDFEKIDNLFD